MKVIEINSNPPVLIYYRYYCLMNNTVKNNVGKYYVDIKYYKIGSNTEKSIRNTQ